MKDYESIQNEELLTWNLTSEEQRREKAQREIARYPMLIKNMGLNQLDTSGFTIFEVGVGPLGGCSNLLPCKKRVCIDPLTNQYNQYYNTHNYLNSKAEDLKEKLGEADLIVATNCIDHFENPTTFLKDLVQYGKGGVFFAHTHCIDNALTHPHEAHQWNLNEEMFKEVLQTNFELVWELTFKKDGVRYGWVNVGGVVGQPCFHQLWRKTTGYENTK